MRITKETLVKELRNILGDVEITFNDITKTNVKKKAVTIKEPGNNIAPSIYLDQFENVNTHKELARKIADIYEANKSNTPTVNLDFIYEFETVAPKLREKLVNTKMNKELLSKVPSIQFLDLSKIFYVKVTMNNGESGIITITNEMLDKWNVSIEEVEDVARENTILDGYELRNISELIPVPDNYTEEEMPMYVLYNDCSFAACLLSHTEILGRIARAKGIDEMVIIPSSVNELIVMPNIKEMIELTQMITQVNSTVLEATDILSNHPYIYNLLANEVYCA